MKPPCEPTQIDFNAVPKQSFFKNGKSKKEGVFLSVLKN